MSLFPDEGKCGMPEAILKAAAALAGLAVFVAVVIVLGLRFGG